MKRVVVLSSEVGDVGGVARATWLLCQALSSLAQTVELFVTLPPSPELRQRLAARGIAREVPILNRGWRARVPQRLLAFQLAWAATRRKMDLIVSVSLSV